MDYGIKVSEEGYDVWTAPDKNLSLKSNFTLLKVYKHGRVVMNGTQTIAHSLSYEPQFLVWTKYPDYPDYEGLDTVLLATGNTDAGMAYVNTSNLYIDPSIAQGNTSPATYYIFYEQLTTGTAPSIPSTNTYGMKVSKDGYDVKTANILQQSFNSEKNCLKIAKEVTGTSTGSSATTIPVAHDQGVVPGYLLYFKVGSGAWYSCWEKEDVSGSNVQVGAISETSNVYIEIQRTSNCTVTYKLYVFVDSGDEPA